MLNGVKRFRPAILRGHNQSCQVELVQFLESVVVVVVVAGIFSDLHKRNQMLTPR